jgi:hypothetical protein
MIDERAAVGRGGPRVPACAGPPFAGEGADPAVGRAGDALVAKKLPIRHIAGAVLRYARTA